MSMFHGGGHGGAKGWAFWVWAAGVFVLIWAFGVSAFVLEQEGHEESAPVAAIEKADGHANEFPITWMALYRALQLFHFHDTHWTKEGPLSTIVLFAAGAYAMGLPLALIGMVFQGEMRRFLHRLCLPGRGNFVVVIGDGPASRTLSRDIRKGGTKVVWAVDADSPSRDSKALRIAGELERAKFWRRQVAVRHAREIVVMTDDDARNISICLAIEEALKGTNATIPCKVHLSDLHLKNGLIRLVRDAGQTGAEHLGIKYFNRYEIIARLLLRARPELAFLTPPVPARRHFIIVGFGQFGQNIALRLVKMAQQIVPGAEPGKFQVRQPKITIVDREGESAAAGFLRAYPVVPSLCEWRVEKLDCRDTKFLDLIFLRSGEETEQCSLIFCLENEALVVSTILAMLDSCESARKDVDEVLFRFPECNGVGHLLHEQRDALEQRIPVVAFAPDDEVFTEDVIFNRSLDRFSEAFHRGYTQVATALPRDRDNPTPAATQAWDELSEDNKESNREAADHAWAKLAALGYRIEENGPAPQRALVDSVNKAAVDHMEELERSEHERWRTWRLLTGWKLGKPKDPRLRVHPNLVSFDALNDIDRHKDSDSIHTVLKLVENGEMHVVREDLV